MARIDKRIMDWSMVNLKKGNYTVAYAPISRRLVALVEVRSDVVVLVVHRTTRPLALMKLYAKGDIYATGVSRICVLDVTLDLCGPHQNDDTESSVRAILADQRMNVVLEGVKDWFDTAGESAKEYRREVSLRNNSIILSHMLDSGFDTFLDDDSISVMRRAMTFLSVLDGGTWDRREYAEANATGWSSPVTVSHLSATLAHRIATTVDLSALEGSDGVFEGGFRLCRPLVAGDYGNRSGTRYHGSIPELAWAESWAEDDKYRFFSVFLARASGVRPSPDNGWVVPRIENTNQMRSAYTSLSGALTEGVPVTDVLLSRINNISDASFHMFQDVLCWVLREVGYICEILPSDLSRMLKVMTIDFVLSRFEESDMDIATFGTELRSGGYLDSLALVGNLPHGHVEACREALHTTRPIAVMLIKAVIASSLTVEHRTSPGLPDVLVSWFESDFDPWELNTLHGQLVAYLEGSSKGEIGTDIPFTWWKSMTYQEDHDQLLAMSRERLAYLPF